MKAHSVPRPHHSSDREQGSFCFEGKLFTTLQRKAAIQETLYSFPLENSESRVLVEGIIEYTVGQA